MNVRTLAAAAVALAALGAGCTVETGTKSAAKAGSNRPASASTAAETDSSAADSSDSSSNDSSTVKFGQSFTYEDGLSVTVSAGKVYRPSEYAAAEKRPYYRVFTVTIVNGTGKKYDPSLFTTTMQSANEEADSVYDSSGGRDIGGAPDTVLLPGREARFQIAYGLIDPKDMVLDVNPGFEYEDAIWTT